MMSDAERAARERQLSDLRSRFNVAAAVRAGARFGVPVVAAAAPVEATSQRELNLNSPDKTSADVLNDVLRICAVVVAARGSAGWDPAWQDACCEILSSSRSGGFRNVSKSLLRRLVGSKQAYAQVKANFLCVKHNPFSTH
jgi:hypothetical protein